MNTKAYSESALYDLAFAYRDYPKEVSTLIHWYKRAGQPRSALELAAGPGRHAIEFARRGVLATALDISLEMTSYCQQVATEQDVSVQAVTADMCAFDLASGFDIVLVLINSICHILTEEDLRSHFGCVANHLNEDGIYVVEAARESPDTMPGESQWREQSGLDHVEVSWAWDHSNDYVRMSGEVSGRAVSVEDSFPMRRWDTDELLALAAEAGLRLIGYSGDFTSDSHDALSSVDVLRNDTPMHGCFVFAKNGYPAQE